MQFHTYPNRTSRCVLERIGKRLTSDSVGGMRDGLWNAVDISLESELHVQAGCSSAGDESLQRPAGVSTSGLWFIGAEQVDEMADLKAGLCRGLADMFKCGPRHTRTSSRHGQTYDRPNFRAAYRSDK